MLTLTSSRSPRSQARCSAVGHCLTSSLNGMAGNCSGRKGLFTSAPRSMRICTAIAMLDSGVQGRIQAGARQPADCTVCTRASIAAATPNCCFEKLAICRSCLCMHPMQAGHAGRDLLRVALHLLWQTEHPYIPSPLCRQAWVHPLTAMSAVWHGALAHAARPHPSSWHI